MLHCSAADVEVERLRDAGAPTSPASGSLRMTSPHGQATAGTGARRAESGTSGSSMLQQDLQYEGPEIDSVGGGPRRKLRLQSGDLVRLRVGRGCCSSNVGHCQCLCGQLLRLCYAKSALHLPC
jgi:hypothetical protein